MTVSRTYTSPLREEQMEQTRERLLETLTELLADERTFDVTVADVAKRARVSVRTAYRYFPTREAMLDAFATWLVKRIGTPHLPRSLADLPATASELVHYFEANAPLMRASRSLAGRQLRARRKAAQVGGLTDIVVAAAPNLDPAIARRRAAAMHQLIGSEGWMNFRDNWGFTQDEVIDTVQWALRALGAQLATENAAAAKPKQRK